MKAGELRRRLAVNIKAIRGKRGISQEKLAELADVSVQTIAFIESCRTWVSDKMLIGLAAALEVDVVQFFIPEAYANWLGSDHSPQSLVKLKESIIDNINALFAIFSPETGQNRRNYKAARGVDTNP
jgi:transcriptional regulator with XRE-family HTH domain